MKRSILLVCAVACALLAAARPVHAGETPPDPAEVAAACIEHMQNLAAQRIEWTDARAAFCVETIEALLEAGHPGQAQHVAMACIHRIGEGTAKTTHRIRERSESCALWLFLHGAPELAVDVLRARGAANGAVRDARSAAVDAIQAALDG